MPKYDDDKSLVGLVADEIAMSALALMNQTEMELNRYTPVTARADCLRLLRAAIELAPALWPQGPPFR